MVIFQYNQYIFRIHLWTVLYQKPCYNELCYKEVVVYMGRRVKALTRLEAHEHLNLHNLDMLEDTFSFDTEK